MTARDWESAFKLAPASVALLINSLIGWQTRWEAKVEKRLTMFSSCSSLMRLSPFILTVLETRGSSTPLRMLTVSFRLLMTALMSFKAHDEI